MPSADQLYWALQAYVSDAHTWDARCILLHRLAAIVLTDEAEDWLSRVTHVAAASHVPDEYPHAGIEVVFALLVRRAREVGPTSAWLELANSGRIATTLYLSEDVATALELQDQLRYGVGLWLAEPVPRNAALFLSRYRDYLLHPLVDVLLLEHIVAVADRPPEVRRLRTPLFILRELRETGADDAAIRKAYVNAYGGLAMEIPTWLEGVEQRVKTLEQEPAPDLNLRRRARLLRAALARALRTPDVVAPECVAELRTLLADVLIGLAPFGPKQLQDEALDLLHAALTVFDQERYPRQYARTQYNLAMVLSMHLGHTYAADQEEALWRCEQALQIHTAARFPEQHANIQMLLGNIYHDRVHGTMSENLERAIAHYETALSVYQEDVYPQEFSRLMHNMGYTYSQRYAGKPARNVRRAIECLEAALRHRSIDLTPFEYSNTQRSLGWCYLHQPYQPRELRLQRAITCFQETLRACERLGRPFEIAWARFNLACAYSERGESGDFERSRDLLGAMLAVCTRDADPAGYAWGQATLASIYFRLGDADDGDVRKRLHHCISEAMSIQTLDAYPEAYRDLCLLRAMVAQQDLARCRTGKLTTTSERRLLLRMHRWLRAARQAQAILLWHVGSEEALTKVRSARSAGNMYLQDAWCLWQLGAPDRALVALEAGRAQALARFQALASSEPQGVCEAHRNEWRAAREALRIARAGDDRDAEGAAFDRIAELHSAIRGHCERSFLLTEPSLADVARATEDGATLVYLFAANEGGAAFVLRPQAVRGRTGIDRGTTSQLLERERLWRTSTDMVDVIRLPQLTNRQVDNWLMQPDDTYGFAGGFHYVVYYPSSFRLADWIKTPEDEQERYRRSATPLRDLCDTLPAHWTVMRSAIRALIDAWSGQPEQAPLLSMSLGEALERAVLTGAFDWHFQKAQIEQLLPELGEVVMTPLREGLDALGLGGDDRRIMLIPCGQLGVLPLHAAPVPCTTSGEPVPFLETCECAYQTSAAQMLGSQRKLSALRVPAPLFVIGAPRPTRAPPLPWAELGARVNVEHARQSGRDLSQACIRDGATRENVRALLAGVRTSSPGAIVELATHGVTDPYDPRACYVLLSRDEELSLAQLQRDALLDGVRCCIAAGCFTAIGDLFTAPDEVSSFASGILQAGAASAIATLWRVSDRATFLLMRKLHTLLGTQASLGPARALREATHWLRQAPREEINELVREAHIATRSIAKADRGRDVARGIVVSMDEEDEEDEEDAPPFAASEDEFRAALGATGYRGFINVDQDASHPYTHPVYWAGFSMYGV